MEIKLVIDVTPKLENLLSNLGVLTGVQASSKIETSAAGVKSTVDQQPAQQPAQQVPAQQPAQQVPAPTQQAQPQQVPTQAPTYTMDQLAVAATQLMDSGKQQELLNLLQTFGVQALTQLQKDQYGAFATKLRELGAKI